MVITMNTTKKAFQQRALRAWRTLQARHPGWGVVSEADARVRDAVRRTDWTRSALNINDPAHVEFAARAVALGAIACFPLANVYVFAARPTEAILRYVNLTKGRPALQTGTFTTTPEHVNEQFDWSQRWRNAAHV